MNPQNTDGMDPKLKAIYDKVMSVPTSPLQNAPVQLQDMPQTSDAVSTRTSQSEVVSMPSMETAAVTSPRVVVNEESLPVETTQMPDLSQDKPRIILESDKNFYSRPDSGPEPDKLEFGSDNAHEGSFGDDKQTISYGVPAAESIIQPPTSDPTPAWQSDLSVQDTFGLSQQTSGVEQPPVQESPKTSVFHASVTDTQVEKTPIFVELLVAAGLIVFLAVYTVVWMKVLGIPVPFLPM